MSTPLAWIRSFEASARRGSLTMAAGELGLTQAAVSQQIKALEGRLGVQLFVRQPRGVILTGAGTELYREVATGLERIDAAVERFARRETGELRIVCNASLAIRWLQPRLAGFRARHPGVALTLRIALWPTDALGVGADVEVLHGPRPPDPKALAVRGGELVAVAGAQAESPAVIAAMGYEEIVEPWRLAVRTGRQAAPPTKVDSFQAAAALAEAGGGRTIAPRLVLADALLAGRLREIPPPAPLMPAAYWCVLSERASVEAETFRDWLCAEAEASLGA